MVGMEGKKEFEAVKVVLLDIGMLEFLFSCFSWDQELARG